MKWARTDDESRLTEFINIHYKQIPATERKLEFRHWS